MKKSFSGEEFVQALAQKSLKEPIILQGMVKEAEDAQANILYSPGSTCEEWIKIPAELIENVEWSGKIPCKDHLHDRVQLQLKDPSDPTSSVFAELLRSLMPQVRVRPGVTPPLPSGSRAEEQIRSLARPEACATRCQACFNAGYPVCGYSFDCDIATGGRYPYGCYNRIP